jgi:hypothetical protein
LSRKLDINRKKDLKIKELEEQKKKVAVVMQLDDIMLPENNLLQKMNSISGFFDDNQGGHDFGEDENYFNHDHNHLEFDMFNYQNPLPVVEDVALIPEPI